MEMITRKELETRRRLFAVAIFFGLSATTAQASAVQTEYLYSNGSPVAELKFFDGGEFSSDYDFGRTIINGVKFGASYWKNIFDLRTTKTPWQIAVTSSERQLITGKTFSFYNAEPTQENFLVQMLQDGRTLEPFDLKSFAEDKISAEDVPKYLQEKAASEGYSALAVLTIGDNLGATREENLRGWHVDDKTILPTNEQAADLVSAVRLELAHALGVEALTDSSTELKFSDALNDRRTWTLHLTDLNRNFAVAGMPIVTSEQFAAMLEENPELNPNDFFIADDKIYFLGRNVTEVLETATFDGAKGIPLNAWNDANFDGVQSLIPGLLSGLPYKNYTTFTELELAAMQDIGYSFDRKKYFGRSIYTNGGTLTNANAWASSEPLAIGLHIWGRNNLVTQRGNISATGTGSVGIRVDGSDNKLIVPQGTQIAGLDKGILVSYGREHNLDIGGEIFSGGNALEFNFGSNMLGAAGEYRGSYLRYLRGLSNGEIITARNLPLVMTDGFNYFADELDGALVDTVNLSGTLYGNRAIYIGKNAFVRNINLDGATIYGDIVSDWKHFTAADGFLSGGAINPIKIQYGGKSFDARKYIPDLTTHLNFNANTNYGGNIIGADNLKMHINAGTLNFTGAADVVSVDVGRGAQLFGGNFTLHDMSADLAEGFFDDTTGTFFNHGTIGAASPDTNLIISGNLVSDGFLKKISGGSAGSIIVNGSANVDGSTVTTDNLLPNETETVLIADSITGEITNPEGKPYPLSSMLNATGKIVGNTLTVTTSEANNLCDLTKQEKETLDAMKSMSDNLSDETQREEMRELYNLNPPEAKKTLSQISSTDAAQIMSVAQQSTAVDKMLSERINKIFSPDYVEVPVRPLKFTDDVDDESVDEVIEVPVKVPARQENNFWLNYSKNWGSLRGGTDYHGSVIVGGYDRPFGKHWRGGIFATYGTIGYSADSSRATVYDTRGGLYAGWHNRESDFYFYINGGQLRNSLHRGISSLGLSTNAKYKSHIIEIGGEYKYDLQPKRTWHVSPFVNFQTSLLRQNAYNEHGAGIYNQHVEADRNTYFAAQIGLDFKRYTRTGMFGIRFGVKHGFTGVDPDLTIRYEGDTSNRYRLRHERDKTHFVFSLRGDNEFANGWFLGGEMELQRGSHDKDLTASLTLRRMW